jgi:hypothetical protein
MISGHEMRAIGLVVAFCAILRCVSADAQDTRETGRTWGIAQLMLSMAQVKTASGRFEERKTLRVLNEPLFLSGTLLYVAPDQVQKITLLPRRERVTISGDTLTIEGGQEDQNRTLSLSDHPEIAGIVEGVRATLAGDLPTLTHFYGILLEGAATDWRLTLQPIDPKLQQFVKWIRIAGRSNKIHTVQTEDGDGDHSEMSIVEDVR